MHHHCGMQVVDPEIVAALIAQRTDLRCGAGLGFRFADLAVFGQAVLGVRQAKRVRHKPLQLLLPAHLERAEFHIEQKPGEHEYARREQANNAVESRTDAKFHGHFPRVASEGASRVARLRGALLAMAERFRGPRLKIGCSASPQRLRTNLDQDIFSEPWSTAARRQAVQIRRAMARQAQARPKPITAKQARRRAIGDSGLTAAPPKSHNPRNNLR